MVFAIAVWWNRGVEVVVKNVDSTRIQNVEVHVTGNFYQLGDIMPGAQKRVGVQAKGESHVEVAFTGADGQAKRHVVDCYFESGSLYRGTIEIQIDDGQIVRHEDNLNISLY